MDNGTHRQWGTGIWGTGAMGYRDIEHMGNGGTVGNGVHGQWGPWMIGTCLPIGPLILHES